MKILVIKLVKRLLLVTVFALLFSSASTFTFAQGECESVGQCIGGNLCEEVELGNGTWVILPVGGSCGSEAGQDVIGNVRPPVGVDQYNFPGGVRPKIGIVYFANVIIKLITIVAGILVMFNFIRAGWMFLAAGDNAKAAGEVKDLLTFSIIGLVIIAVTYTIAALIGLIFFGDANFILKPELFSAVAP